MFGLNWLLTLLTPNFLPGLRWFSWPGRIRLGNRCPPYPPWLYYHMTVLIHCVDYVTSYVALRATQGWDTSSQVKSINALPLRYVSSLCMKHPRISLNTTTVQRLLMLKCGPNAQRDGRPAEYRWRPLFNAPKFGWRPILECRAVTLPRRESRWN